MRQEVRVTQASRILGISAGTVRKWADKGILKFNKNAAGQRVFDVDYLNEFRYEKSGIPVETLPIFYVRSSNRNDVTTATQIEKLTANFGDPAEIFTDNSSGLNEHRRGLKKLYAFLESTPGKKTVYITNKDRLTRFGYTYLEKYFACLNTNIVVLDADETKESHEVLMQDFMSLLASFSGKFYRMRGWTQQKKFLKDVEKEIADNA